MGYEDFRASTISELWITTPERYLCIAVIHNAVLWSASPKIVVPE